MKIRKTVVSDSLELSGLSQFQGQEVEIIISPISPPHTTDAASFMRFAGLAATEAALLKDLEREIEINRDHDLHRQPDL
ncbi:hypothetical protein [Leptolyngbya sp. NIES-2104]|uniref:hypothetical protein n=1 Tax=Leptolyngbya sp. NIES-2104 TaxID=1552121 RepID=UPI0012E33F1B|nr:hypothetical protein [Leptolyngbya sp. NIES-2104]